MEPGAVAEILLPAYLCTHALLRSKSHIALAPLALTPNRIYCQLGIKTRLQDFYIFWIMKNCKYSIIIMLWPYHLYSLLLHVATIRLNRPFLNQWIIFFCGKLTHVTYRFVIPAFFMPWYTLVSSSRSQVNIIHCICSVVAGECDC